MAEERLPERKRRVRDSLLEAMLALVAEHGYASVSIKNVIEEAGVGRGTFYEHFEDREACFLAAYDRAIDLIHDQLSLVDRVAGPLMGEGAAEASWPRRLQASLHAVIGFLDKEPGLGRVALIEVAASGPAGTRRYQAALERFTGCLEEGRSMTGLELPESVSLMALGGACAMAADELRSDQPDLGAQLPDLFFALLMPFVGTERAAAEMQRAYDV